MQSNFKLLGQLEPEFFGGMQPPMTSAGGFGIAELGSLFGAIVFPLLLLLYVFIMRRSNLRSGTLVLQNFPGSMVAAKAQRSLEKFGIHE